MPIYLLTEKLVFPPVDGAENGIVAIGGDLSTERLLLAYRNGIFPWYSDEEPIVWHAPDPRFVLMIEDLHVSKSMRRVLNSKKFKVSFDTNFQFVIQQCATVERVGQDGTWITNAMQNAFINLHEEGFAHSVEVWNQDRIVGGLYGVCLGKVFFAESMFHTESNASKVALICLVNFLKQIEVQFIDAQVYTSHVESLGAKNISRNAFMELLKTALNFDTFRGKWI